VGLLVVAGVVRAPQVRGVDEQPRGLIVGGRRGGLVARRAVELVGGRLARGRGQGRGRRRALLVAGVVLIGVVRGFERSEDAGRALGVVVGGAPRGGRRGLGARSIAAGLA